MPELLLFPPVPDLILFPPVPGEARTEVIGLRQTHVQRMDVGLGQQKAGLINLAISLGPVSRIAVKPNSRRHVARAQCGLNRIVTHSAAALAGAIRSAIQAWKQWVGPSIAGENLPPSK